jgi:hypothetical protein
MLLRDRNREAVFRVVFIDTSTQHTWLCRIDDNSWTYPIPTRQLSEEMDPEKGIFTVEHEDPWARPSIFVEEEGKEESAAHKRHKHRWALIEPLVTGNNERRILFKRDRKKLIDSRLMEVKSSCQTIRALLKQFWKRGMTFEALRNDYANCGAAGKRRTLTVKKVGAPRIIMLGTGINATEKVRRQLSIAADYYLSRKKPNPTLRDALDHIIRLYFSARTTDEKGRVVYAVEPDAKPTLRQLQWFIKTHYSDSHIKRRRNGDKNWNLKERELLGAADGDVQGPGDRFQIDATIADAYLASQFDRRRIVGRPIIYFIVDVWSRMIVGIYVGFEGPSWIGAMMALVNMVTPKIEFCRQYGIEIDESDWPSHYAPKRIMGDRGELMSVLLGKNITQFLRIEIENASPGRADLKSLVERRFGIVPAKFRAFTPGYVEKDFNERGARDYRLDAALNLREFTQLVIYAVLEHNFTPIRDKSLPAAMITEELTAAPIDLWQWGVVNRSGSLRTLTVEQVALNVMPLAKARVTAHGIRFGGDLYYSCATAMREEWFSKARSRGWDVTMSYDPRNMECAYLRDPKLPRDFEVCNLLDRSYDYRGKSLFEIEELRLAKKQTEAAGENDRQAKRILIDRKMSEIQKEAKKATKAVADPDTPKSKKVAGIRGNRAEEKEVQRGAESFDLTGAVLTDTSGIPSETPSVSCGSKKGREDELSLLEAKRKAREGR